MVYNNIEAERVRHDLSKDQISGLLGVTTKTYSKYINGSSIPSRVLLRLSDLFGCSIDYLLESAGQRNPPDEPA